MSLTLVRQGIATQADVAGLLQDCLDDMGLALDSLSAEGAELFMFSAAFTLVLLPALTPWD
jgi:hypothetical protein